VQDLAFRSRATMGYRISVLLAGATIALVGGPILVVAAFLLGLPDVIGYLLALLAVLVGVAIAASAFILRLELDPAGRLHLRRLVGTTSLDLHDLVEVRQHLVMHPRGALMRTPSRGGHSLLVRTRTGMVLLSMGDWYDPEGIRQRLAEAGRRAGAVVELEAGVRSWLQRPR
jgi:hypothetical protein